MTWEMLFRVLHALCVFQFANVEDTLAFPFGFFENIQMRKWSPVGFPFKNPLGPPVEIRVPFFL